MERLFSAICGETSGRGMRLVKVLALLAGLGLNDPLLSYGQAAADAAKPADTAKPQEPAKPAEPAAKPAGKPLQFQEGEDPVEPLEAVKPRDAEAANVVAARAWYGTGRILEAANDFRGAYNAYKKAVELDPKAVVVYRSLIQLAFNLNQVDDAIRYAMKAVELDPSDYQLLRRIGIHQASIGEYAGAIRFLEQALAAPNIDKQSALYVTLKRDLAILYEATDLPDAAAGAWETVFDALQTPDKYSIDFRTLSQLRGDPPATFERIGQAFLKAKKFELALAAFRKAGETKKAKSGNLAYNLALTQLEMDKADEALATLQSYFDEQRQSKGREAYELLERILTKLNKSGELVGRLEKISEADNRNTTLQYFLAEKYREARQLDKAEALYLAAIKTDPDGPGHVGLAAVYRELNNPEQLLKALAKAAERSLGEMMGEAGGMDLLQHEIEALSKDAALVDALLAMGDRLKEKGELDLPLTYTLANIAAEAKQTDAAAKFYDHIITAFPEKAERAYRELAGHYVDVAKYADAAAVYKRASQDDKLSDDRAQFLYMLSNAEELAGNTQAALEAISNARKLLGEGPGGKGNPLIDFQEAWIYYHSRQWEEAIARFEKLISTYPEPQFRSVYRRAQFSLSNVFVQKGEVRRGEQILEDVLKETPNDPSVNNDLGYLYADQGKNLEQAEQMIRKAVKAEPENGAYLDSLGWVLFKLGKKDEAIPLLEKAVVKIGKGGDDTVWDHLGDVYDSTGNAAKALECWRKALESAKVQPRPDDKLIGKVEEKIRNREKSASGAVPKQPGTP